MNFTHYSNLKCFLFEWVLRHRRIALGVYHDSYRRIHFARQMLFYWILGVKWSRNRVNSNPILFVVLHNKLVSDFYAAQCNCANISNIYPKICNFHLSPGLCCSKWKCIHSQIRSHIVCLCTTKIIIINTKLSLNKVESQERVLLLLMANVFRHISLQIYHNHSFICLLCPYNKSTKSIYNK